jgi:membrane-associated protease RseP (regulator of RpoE activity)
VPIDASSPKSRLSRGKRVTMAALLAVAILLPIGAATDFWPLTSPAPANSSLSRANDRAPQSNTTGVIYSWRGLLMRPELATDRSSSEGMFVERVEPNTPARTTGLRQGDIITALDGMPVDTARNLAMAIADNASGPIVTLKVWRDHHLRSIELRPNTPPPTTTVARQVERDQTGRSVRLTQQPVRQPS